MPETLSHTEDDLQSLVRRRVIQQLEIITTLTDEQDTAMDSLCALLPVVDEPNLLARLAVSDRPAAIELLKQLPTTHVITRCLEGRWPT